MSIPSASDLGIALEQEDPNKLFEIVGTIGRGTFGSVYKARNNETGEIVAVKQVPAIGDTDELKTVIKEIQTLEHCEHPNIVQYRGTYRARSSSELWITMEYCVGGSFDNILKVLKRPLSERLAGYVARQMLQGLAYLHRDHHIHRDIKGGNVLLTESGEVKLTDFGVSAQMMTTISKRNSFVGTLHWMAPETIQEKEYDERADIWSLGITIIELLELKPPNFNMHPARLLFHIPKSDPPTLSPPHDRWSSAVRNFLRRCLIKNPETRPTAEELLTDPFVCNLAGAQEDLQEMLAEYSSMAEGLSTARKYLGETEPTPDPTPRGDSAGANSNAATANTNNAAGGSPPRENDDSDDPTFIVDPNAGGAGGGADANSNQYLAATEAAGMAHHLLVDIPLVKLNEVSLMELDVAACGYLGIDSGVGLGGGYNHHSHHSQKTNFFDALDPVTLLTNRHAVGPPPAPAPITVFGGKQQGTSTGGTKPNIQRTSAAVASAKGSVAAAESHGRTRSGNPSGGPSPLMVVAQQYSSGARSNSEQQGTDDASGLSAVAGDGDSAVLPYVATLPKHLTHSTKMMLHSFDYHSQGKFTSGVTDAQVQESVALSEKYGSLLKSTLQI